MKKKHIKFLKRIVETPSPTGDEVRVAEIVRGRLGDVADEITTDTMGSVHAALYAAQRSDQDADDSQIELNGSALTVMLAAHMDEIGLMVTYISDDGFLSVAAVGGVDAAILPGMRVDVHTQAKTLRGVVGRKPIHLIDPDERKNVTPIDKLMIDLGMPGKQVRKYVRVGDQITIGVGFERFGSNMAVSRAFDDKVGVFIACRVMENLAEDPDYKGNFIAAITVQEEIGTRGAITSAHSINPDVALAFDVTHATDYPGIDKTKYGNIVCGKGPVIARGPNINPVVFAALEQAADEESIKFQLEAEPSVTGTDARSIQVTRGGIPTGLVSIPLRYMHTPTEVINLDDVEGAVRLITRFVKNVSDIDCFVPGMGDTDYVTSGQDDADFEDVGINDLSEVQSKDSSSDTVLENEYPPITNPEDAPFGRQHDSLISEFRAFDIEGIASQNNQGYWNQETADSQPADNTQLADNAQSASNDVDDPFDDAGDNSFNNEVSFAVDGVDGGTQTVQVSTDYANLIEDGNYWSELAENTPSNPIEYHADMASLQPDGAADTGPLHGIPVVKLDDVKEE